MKLSYLCDMLDQVAKLPGKNDKIALLKLQLQEDKDFCLLIDYMLNPYITFGVLDFPDYTYDEDRPSAIWLNPPVDATFWELIDLLQMLKHRQLTGLAAAHQLGIMAARGVGRDLMLRILNKDPKAGFGVSSVNKAWPGLLPEFPYMRCSLPKASNLEDFPWERGVISQIKADGMFVNINKTFEGDIHLSTRQGTVLPLGEFAPLVEELEKHIQRGTQTHGELLVVNSLTLEVLPREIGNGILNSVAQGGKLEEHQVIRCQVWDQIPLSSVKPKGRETLAYFRRFSGLRQQISEAHTWVLQPIPHRLVRSRQEAYEHYQEVLNQGLEGTILKHPNAIWRDGTSRDQVKLKLEADCDLKVIGFRAGNGKNEKTFGAIVARTADDLLEVGVSGFSDAQRVKIWKEKGNVIGSIMTVKANMVMKPSANNKLHSLFLPRFVELRQDKDEADTLEQVQNQFEAAKQGVGK